MMYAAGEDDRGGNAIRLHDELAKKDEERRHREDMREDPPAASVNGGVPARCGWC
jgi:hypothetical protein